MGSATALTSVPRGKSRGIGIKHIEVKTALSSTHKPQNSPTRLPSLQKAEQSVSRNHVDVHYRTFSPPILIGTPVIIQVSESSVKNHLGIII